MEETVVDVPKEGSTVSNGRWVIGGEKVPKEEIVFFSQLSIIALVVLVGLLNLCLNNGTESYWAAMVATGLGALLPAPTIKKKEKVV